MQIRFKAQPIWTQIADLTLIQLSNWRWAWRSTLVIGMVAPCLTIAALGVFARDSGAEALSYILVGNIVLALMFGIQNKVCSNFTYMKAVGTLNYFASLPIQRPWLILGTIISFIILYIPALVLVILFGSFYLKVDIHLNLLAPMVFLLAAVSVSALGALIGTASRTPEEAGSLNTLLTFLLMGIGPVFIPPEKLPAVLLTLGKFSPATYAASAIRQTLLGPTTGQLWVDIGALLAFSLVSFWIVSRKMEWRQ